MACRAHAEWKDPDHMRDRVALACFALACLAATAGAIFDLLRGNYGSFWWFVVILSVLLAALTLQLRHIRRRSNPGDSE